MAEYAFCGATISGVTGNIIDCSVSRSCQAIDVTGCDSSTHVYEAGIEDIEASVTIIGSTAHTIGSAVSFSCAWLDGTGTDAFSAIITGIETSGALDDKVTTKFTLKPVTAT